MSEVDTAEFVEEWSAPRRAMIAHALGVVGLNARIDPEGYIELLAGFDIETAPMRHDMLTMSGCALTVRGLWRRVGVVHPLLAAPYRLQHAVSDLEVIARERGAWRDPVIGDAPPKPGDVVIVARGEPHEHVFTVTGIRVNEGRMLLCSVDGGQRDEHRAEVIRAYEREWVLKSGVPRGPGPETKVLDTVITKPGEAMHPVRLVSGWIDLDAVMAGQ